MATPSMLYGPDYFEGHEYGRDPKRDTMYRQEYTRILERVQGDYDNAKLLDVGCGVGAFAAQFDDRWRRFGFDVSSYALNKACASGMTVCNTQAFLNGALDNRYKLIIWRGTFQHIDEPMRVLKKCVGLLDGMICFLATPNSNSPVYQKRGTLPALDAERNFVIPSDIMLVNILKNLGLKRIEVLYPYKETPYAKRTDRLMHRISKKANYAYPRSMMEVYAWSE